MKSDSTSAFSFSRVRLFAALREVFKQGYDVSKCRDDVAAGAVVSLVAVPLGMALAVASGVAPQYGLYTVIVGGLIVALLGGSRFQVTGPTAAFVVILAPIAHKFGFSGLLVAGALAGIFLVLMGLARFGQFIQYIPHPVTTGFTSGIAVVIATIQIKDFLGLQLTEMPVHYFEKWGAIFHALPTLSLVETAIGIFSLLGILYWPKVSQKIPAPLVILTLSAVLAFFIQKLFPEAHIATIGNRFSYEANGGIGHGIPRSLPLFAWPWSFGGGVGSGFELTFSTVRALLPSAFAIAMLGAIESLLSATVADGMTQTKHDPNAELVALGIGNIICPFFGGIAATGAIARTATNIRYGAKSPMAAVFHSLFTLLIVLLFAPLVSYLPMAALAALLLRVAYNMAERKHFSHIVSVAPRSDVIVLLTCFGLTVAFDMVVGVTFGMMAASLLFMRRMVLNTSVELVSHSSHPHLSLKGDIPKGMMIYEIAGPLFFGAAHTAMEALGRISDDVQRVVFLMDGVPHIDMTGLSAFESAISKLQKEKKEIYLVGVRDQTKFLLQRAHILVKDGNVKAVRSLEEALHPFSNV